MITSINFKIMLILQIHNKYLVDVKTDDKIQKCYQNFNLVFTLE